MKKNEKQIIEWSIKWAYGPHQLSSRPSPPATYPTLHHLTQLPLYLSTISQQPLYTFFSKATHKDVPP